MKPEIRGRGIGALGLGDDREGGLELIDQLSSFLSPASSPLAWPGLACREGLLANGTFSLLLLPNI